MDKLGARKKGDEVYLADGKVRLVVDVEVSKEEEFTKSILNLTAGRCQPLRIRE